MIKRGVSLCVKIKRGVSLCVKNSLKSMFFRLYSNDFIDETMLHDLTIHLCDRVCISSVYEEGFKQRDSSKRYRTKKQIKHHLCK